MSQSEVERFVADLKENDALREELTLNASGVGSVVEFAKAKGYDITADEARSYIQSQTEQELSDEELDAVAGGKGGGVDPNVATNVAVSANVTEQAAVAGVTAINTPAVEAVIGTQTQAAVVIN